MNEVTLNAKIVVVDDDASVRETLASILTDAGAEVLQAESGRIALELLSSGAIDILITDIVMPDTDGISLLSEVRQKHPGLSVLAISGAPGVMNNQFLNAARKFGAHDVLSKPITRASLIERVSALASRRSDADGSLDPGHNRYKAVASCLADTFMELDGENSVAFASDTLAAALGKPPASLIGHDIEDVFAAADRVRIQALLESARKHGRAEDNELHVRVVGSANQPSDVIASWRETDGGRHVVVFLFHANGLTLVHNRDTESGLYDDKAFKTVAATRIAELRESGQEALMSVLAMPELQKLQDRLDPETRDSLMQTIGTILRANSIGGDTASQIAGDKFSFVHEEGLDLSAIETGISEVTRDADPQGIGAGVHHATMELPDASVSVEEASNGLMVALRQFKEESDGQLDFSTLAENLGDIAARSTERVLAFKKIVSEKAFNVHFHPIIDVRTAKIHHYEALVRFNHTPGESSPFREITFAEESDLIHEFDIAMVDKVVSWLAGKPRNRPIPEVAVNVSGNSIDKPMYVDALHRILKANEWLKDVLMFEITESAHMSNLEDADRFIQGLRSLGFRVCLDDFGAGSASFQYLSVLEVDVVKLDGSTVKNAERSPKGTAFLTALSELCKRLEVETVAEMIDNQQSLNFVRSCGVDFVQGFLFGEPAGSLESFEPLPHRDLITRR